MRRPLVHVERDEADVGIFNLSLDSLDVARLRDLRPIVDNARARGIASIVLPPKGDISLRLHPDAKIEQVLGDFGDVEMTGEARKVEAPRQVVNDPPL